MSKLAKISDHLFTPSEAIEKTGMKSYYTGKYKSIFGLLISSTIVLAILLSYGIEQSHVQNVKLCLSEVVILLTNFILFRRKFYNLWKAGNTIVILMHGPMSLHLNNNIFFYMLSSHLLPNMMCIFSESRIAMILLAISQAGIYSFVFPHLPAYNQLIVEVPYFSQIVSYSTLAIFINLILVILMQKNFISWKIRLEDPQKNPSHSENKELFLFSLSHEIRNVVGQITTNLDMISTISQETSKYISNAKFCGDILLDLISTLLDNKKMENRKLEINPVPIDIYETFAKIWSLCSGVIKKKKLDGTLTLYRNLPKNLTLDSHRLSQIVLNLIQYSAKSTETGSVNINAEFLQKMSLGEWCFNPIPYEDHTLYTKNQLFNRINKESYILTSNQAINPILFTNLNEKDLVNEGILKITICDSGAGLEEDVVANLFNKTTPGTNGGPNKQKEHDMELHIVHKLCKLMKGEVRAYSRVNLGTTFIICIPCSKVVS